MKIARFGTLRVGQNVIFRSQWKHEELSMSYPEAGSTGKIYDIQKVKYIVSGTKYYVKVKWDKKENYCFNNTLFCTDDCIIF